MNPLLWNNMSSVSSRRSNFGLLLTFLVLFGGTTAAHAFTPIPFADVKQLQGKHVYLADSVELDRKNRGWGYAGEAVTLAGCDKSTTTNTTDTAKVSGWKYSRCKVTTAEGVTGSVPFKLLSKTALKFDLRKPGKAAALRRAAFDEAFDTALAMVTFAKAHGAELASNVVTSTLDGAPVLGEYYERWHAMAAAQQVAQRLHRELVVGSRLTTESAMRDRKYGWVIDAEDDALLQAWTKGADAAQKRRLEAGLKALGKLNGVAAWGTLAIRTSDELAARSWRRGASGTEAQLAALDKEHEARLTRRLEEGRAAFAKQLQEAQAMRRSLTW